MEPVKKDGMEGLYQALLQRAAEARETAYCPYSGFAVGAALLCADGTVYSGCNIECASLSPGSCAERTAFFRAVGDGKREFLAIAIAGGPAHEPPRELCPPCGVCRQTKSGIPWRSCCPFPLGRSSWESGKSVEACFPCLWEQAPEKEAVLCAWWISFTKNGRAVN